ncbi:hypothetical protein [Paraburkholderia sp. SG-MS1]|uniref:hypothetical protein n=1 Tax=Paraburkholderia sp. SG-MS1 TaxID=2023741 RepID=UPI001EEAC74F|nr:hypothetical protein [Paraburkholderia sp. SG-MS1]
MNHERTSRDAQAAILLRMAASREALLVANRAPPAVPVVRGQTRSTVASVVTSLAEAPRVTLLLALCVGAIVLGPRRTVGIVGRSGITAWLGRAARKAITQDV